MIYKIGNWIKTAFRIVFGSGKTQWFPNINNSWDKVSPKQMQKVNLIAIGVSLGLIRTKPLIVNDSRRRKWDHQNTTSSV